MRRFRFAPDSDLILVPAILHGNSRIESAQLVFDTGCMMTQIDRGRLKDLGYSEADKVQGIDISGVTKAAKEETYSIKLASLKALGFVINDLEVAVADFRKWKSDEIDGLIGWDLIRRWHIDVNGPAGELLIY